MMIEHSKSGCDYCNSPLFLGRKCKNCDKVFWDDESAQTQEPVLDTPTIRAMVERLAAQVDPAAADIAKWPEALLFQVEMARAVMKEVTPDAAAQIAERDDMYFIKACQSYREQIATLEAELRKWQQPFDQELFDATKQQASHQDSLAAMQVYINALEHALKHKDEQIAALEEEAKRYCQNADYWRERAESWERDAKVLQEQIKHLTDPIVHAKMLEPAPPIIMQAALKPMTDAEILHAWAALQWRGTQHEIVAFARSLGVPKP